MTAVAAAELLKTADASVGEVVDQRAVAQLPLNGRMLVDLMLTVPGAHLSHGAQTGDMNPLYWRPGQRSAISVGEIGRMRIIFCWRGRRIRTLRSIRRTSAHRRMRCRSSMCRWGATRRRWVARAAAR